MRPNKSVLYRLSITPVSLNLPVLLIILNTLAALLKAYTHTAYNITDRVYHANSNQNNVDNNNRYVSCDNIHTETYHFEWAEY